MTCGYVLLYYPKPDELRFRKMMGGPMGWWTSDPTQAKLYKDLETILADQAHIAKVLPLDVVKKTKIARVILKIKED